MDAGRAEMRMRGFGPVARMTWDVVGALSVEEGGGGGGHWG